MTKHGFNRKKKKKSVIIPYWFVGSLKILVPTCKTRVVRIAVALKERAHW
ncbi:hypothetical protein DDB_G0285731 [Dictyostelium discoideum AX4]|uniref:Uncharacterized protein n=1 Tax=Dictyostelium discoideum TaxID=44689 RepID=Q54MX1_DICDI|nr:hypothetical protein DDB_G0285731 [Dictyostelium discoideum AX4]EAL64703.1 hypothetical protein DDB_G0285731 [Dictyostelium discoideum AX4]|eukprot:XP_638172.1 hypothetical protein DDB_G0285731 [Dictyostelium discoideum AX4]